MRAIKMKYVLYFHFQVEQKPKENFEILRITAVVCGSQQENNKYYYLALSDILTHPVAITTG